MILIMCAFVLLASSPAFAGKADVIGVKLTKSNADMYRISVTVAHDDTGWGHYADQWDVLDEAGKVLGSRILMHPHENEQPFTRSMSLSIPMEVKKITVRARDKKHGYGGKTMTVNVTE
ncbi:hypothetical protein GUA87_11315 [Sneathiella sp. P13V-1]|uniref:hypothetical protein n=1 Tax=Sneathiella sp. P13V-1 TaxID=2697366 RepID=UPI00187B6206|nr:hypothetical protein [Sneathiella sp. P13V-1]MBE7637435.1 hypothetical protein [Sneathiella sp. P13V-1]